MRRIVKVTGYVASAAGFNRQPEVINGASDILGEVFGERGTHARSAVGVAELPLDVPVEVELIVELTFSNQQPKPPALVGVVVCDAVILYIAHQMRGKGRA